MARDLFQSWKMPSYKLYYFPLRARAEPIRMLLALAEVEYDNIRVPFDEWEKTYKPTMPFGMMPVLEVDGAKLPQTRAILRYLAEEYGYRGSSPLERARVDAVMDLVADFDDAHTPWYMVHMGWEDGDKEKAYTDVYKPALAKFLPMFSKMLTENTSGWLVGDNFTMADLFAATNLEFLEQVDPHSEHLYDGFPELKELKERVFAIPAIAKHIATRPDDSR